MTILSELSCADCWERFSEYRDRLPVQRPKASALARTIEEKSYIPVVQRIRENKPFPLPRRAVISKMASQKKRVVYIYPEPENTVLKLLTFLLLRKYDGLFSDGLYSFRPGRTAQDAVRRLRSTPGIEHMWAYKVDISNYFNSVPVERFLPRLKEALADEPELYGFLAGLLLEPRVIEGGRVELGAEADEALEPGAEDDEALELGAEDALRVGGECRLIAEQKGIMAGTPLSAFYANLYLKDLDRRFAELGAPYARYSDDIIVFAETEAEMRRRAEEIRSFLAEEGLSVNPAKENFYAPGDGWTFLGFCYKDGVTDIAPATVAKLKAKMRRKARALARWRDRKGVSGEKAALAFIRKFNNKLLGPGWDKSIGAESGAEQDGAAAEHSGSEELPGEHELNWSRWFFPLINTTESLQLIDSYAQDQLRFLISGKRTKSRFNVRYEDLKALGYRSLVNEYYKNRHQGDGSSDA